MYNLKLFKIFLFTYLCCISYRAFFQNLIPEFKIPHFSSSFKPIRGFAWETSTINPEILIKLYGIKLISQIKNSNLLDVIIHTVLLESTLLFTNGKSSVILSSIISILTFLFLKV